jgi:16S rRNA (guanine527-N7)-methyltransferase
MNRLLDAFSQSQREQLAELERHAIGLYKRLNLYSQASMERFWLLHIEHSLTLATRPFPPGSVVADWGTGGGMPGLVLAIVFPEATFHLIDSVRKKIRAVQTMARRLALTNVEVHHARAEAWEGRITHSVSRATAPLPTLWSWHRRVAVPSEATQADESPAWEPGLICLKGGDLTAEIDAVEENDRRASVIQTPIGRWIDDPHFDEKVLVQVRHN